MEQPLRLYDQRLFTLLMGLHRSPLLGLLSLDIFKLIMARCRPWQTCKRIKWTKKETFKEWLIFENRSLLIMGIKKYCYEAPILEKVWRLNQWQLTYTPRKMVFELHSNEQLIASGPLRWCTNITFATPADDTRTRAYFQLRMGHIGSCYMPRNPISAHAGLIEYIGRTTPQQPIHAHTRRCKKRVADYKKKRSGYDWTRIAGRSLSIDEVADDEWCTVLTFLDFRLRVRWV